MRARLARLVDDEGLPSPEPLPRYVAPLPTWLENVGLQLAWLVVAINLVGTAFGFWYYGARPLSLTVTDQLAHEPLVMWPLVPDSPVATLFFALAVAAWKLGRPQDWLAVLAFFGCIKTGLWTPYVLLVFKEDFAYLHPAMYNFLFWSHLAMVVQAFILHRIADFSVFSVGVALLWHGLNDLVDYLVPIVGDPHHTFIPSEPRAGGVAQHGAGETVLLGGGPHELAAAGAIALTLLSLFLALATRIEKLKRT